MINDSKLCQAVTATSNINSPFYTLKHNAEESAKGDYPVKNVNATDKGKKSTHVVRALVTLEKNNFEFLISVSMPGANTDQVSEKAFNLIEDAYGNAPADVFEVIKLDDSKNAD